MQQLGPMSFTFVQSQTELQQNMYRYLFTVPSFYHECSTYTWNKVVVRIKNSNESNKPVCMLYSFPSVASKHNSLFFDRLAYFHLWLQNLTSEKKFNKALHSTSNTCSHFAVSKKFPTLVQRRDHGPRKCDGFVFSLLAQWRFSTLATTDATKDMPALVCFGFDLLQCIAAKCRRGWNQNGFKKSD